MLTPKRASALGTPNSAKVTRSQSLKSKNELFSAAVSASGGVPAPGRISLAMNSIYNDSILESYKSSLPIRVNELIFQIKSQDSNQVNANILPNGYVCLVNERKVIIWKLKKSLKNVQCNELTLPYSRSAIKPSCISVEAQQQNNGKDCVGLCVTVEGSVRYWPSISNEYMCVDAKFDLAASDEVSQLIYLADEWYLVVTANGNLWSIVIECEDGKITPICRQIETSSGFISSVSRRMTSLIFGGGGSGSLIKAQSFKSCVRYKQMNELYILVDKNLQKWRINTDDTLNMLCQSNLEKLFYEAYLEENPDNPRINITFQDCTITKNSIYVLALVDDEGQKFVIGEIETYNRGQNESTTINKLKSFSILNYNFKEGDQQHQYKLHAMDNQHAFYVYNGNSVISFTGPTLELTGESRFNTLGDKLIASNHVDGDLVFFSLNHGILRTKDNSVRLSIDEENFSSLQNQSLDNNTSFGNIMAHRSINQTLGGGFNNDMSLNMSGAGEDISFSVRAGRQAFDFTFSNLTSPDQTVFGLLKDAFQSYLKKEERQSQNLIDEVLKLSTVDRKLDLICIELSERLIDDVPTHDPRWAEFNAKTSAKSSMNTSLIIGNQLKGKIRIHEYYLTFLKKMSLWDKLTSFIYNGREIRTALALQEHGEKLQLALTIREHLYSKNSEFINMAIEHITKNREEPNSKLIYPHDLFYRRVSKIDDIFNALYLIENEVIKVNSNEQAINYIIDTCFFFVKLLKTSQTYRKEKSRLYESQGTIIDDYSVETIRWPFLPLNEVINVTPSILNLCVKQHKLSSEYGLVNCNTLENKATILQNLYELDELIFDEYELRLSSIEADTNDNEYANLKLNYDSLKTKLIEIFVKQKQIENAMKLAERYVDFSTLVSICELKSDSELLNSYLDKFQNTKFAEFVVRYFMEKKKLNFLLKNQFLKRADISSCLDKYKYLSWIKDFKNDSYKKASDTLVELGEAENESFMKQKSLYSLSKLSLLAENRFVPDLDARLNSLDRKLEYLQYIESQATFISNNTGLLIDQIPFYNAERLIDIYISNPDANEFDFKKAFELIDYLNEDKSKFYNEQQMIQLKIEILVRTVLSDNWEKLYDLDYPESSLKETKFFKTLSLIKESGESIEELAASKEDLMSHELLGHLAKNRKFEYLLHACFEIILSS